MSITFQRCLWVLACVFFATALVSCGSGGGSGEGSGSPVGNDDDANATPPPVVDGVATSRLNRIDNTPSFLTRDCDSTNSPHLFCPQGGVR